MEIFFGNNNVSIESIVQLDASEDKAEIIVITHEVNNGNFWEIKRWNKFAKWSQNYCKSIKLYLKEKFANFFIACYTKESKSLVLAT